MVNIEFFLCWVRLLSFPNTEGTNSRHGPYHMVFCADDLRSFHENGRFQELHFRTDCFLTYYESCPPSRRYRLTQTFPTQSNDGLVRQFPIPVIIIWRSEIS